MICLLAVAFGLTGLVVLFAEKREKASDELVCVTSFYPVYLLAESVADGAEGVTVRNLTENHSGCLHDYTLTTQDMRLLSEAELFLINGGEMELFLEKAAAEYQSLVTVDTSAGYAFLEGITHDHSHGEAEEHDEDELLHAGESGLDEHEEEDAHVHALNAHLWLDIDGYLLQLSRVEEAFVAVDPAQTALYRANAEKCRAALSELKAEFASAKEVVAGAETVVFHEGFVYLMHMLGVETVHCLSMDSDVQISAGEAAEIIDECTLHGITRLFAEAEYAQTVRDTFAGEIGGDVVVLDPVTGGTMSGDTETAVVPHGIAVYCEKMRENLTAIRQAFSVQ